MDLVSVIMPYYKKRNYIKNSIKSVLAQSYKNFEIIIIYDDNDKFDVDYIKNIQKLDRRIRVIYNKKNIGAGPSRNLGIKFAKGIFVAFLDCDDFWHKNKLKLQMNFMKKKKINLSFTAYNIINCKNYKIATRSAKPILKFNNLIKSCDIGLSTVILKKSLVNNFCKFPNLKTKEDFVLWLRLSKKNFFYGLNVILSTWRISKNSLSSDTLQKISDAFLVYRKYMKFNLLKSIYFVLILSFNFILKKYL